MRALLRRTMTRLARPWRTDVLFDLARDAGIDVDAEIKNARSRPSIDMATLEKLVGQVPDRDYSILRAYESGMRHHEIASELQMTEDAVRRSLAKTLAGLLYGPDTAADARTESSAKVN